MSRSRHVPSADRTATRERWVIAGLAQLATAYAALYFSARLSNVPLAADGSSLTRGFFLAHLLLPEEMVGAWFGDGAPLGVGDRLPIIATALGLWLVAAALGRLILAALGVDRTITRLEIGIFSAAAGANALSLYLLICGLAGHLTRPWLLIPAGLASAAAFALALRDRLRARPATRAEVEPAATSATRVPNARWWILPATLFALPMLASACLPARDFDAREYHLQAPKEFFEQGRITFLPHNVYANMPLGAEMFSLAGMVVLGDFQAGALAGDLTIAGYTLLTALGLFVIGRRYASAQTGAIAAVLYLATPWVVHVSSNGLNEGPAACYWLLTPFALALWAARTTSDNRTTPDNHDPDRGGFGRLILAGWLAGSAVSIKYPGLLFVVLPMLAVVGGTAWRRAGANRSNRSANPADKRARLPAAAGPMVVFGLASALACGPWFAKNLLLTGNPTYPLGYRLFDGATRTAEKDAQWQKVHSPPNFSPSDLVHRAAGVLLWSDWLNPLIVPLAAVGIWGTCLRSRAVTTGGAQNPPAWLPGARPLAWCSLAGLLWVFLAWWLFTHRLDRFWVPAMPAWALLAGLGATWSRERIWRWALAAWLTLGLGYDFSLITSGVIADNRYFVTLATLAADDQRTLCPAHQLLDAHVPPGKRALLVGDATPFDLHVPALYNTVFDDSIFDRLTQDRTPAQVAQALAEEKISHVYVDWSEIRRYRSPGNYGLLSSIDQAALTRLVDADVLEKVYADDRGEIYRVLAVARPAGSAAALGYGNQSPAGAK